MCLARTSFRPSSAKHFNRRSHRLYRCVGRGEDLSNHVGAALARQSSDFRHEASTWLIVSIWLIARLSVHRRRICQQIGLRRTPVDKIKSVGATQRTCRRGLHGQDGKSQEIDSQYVDVCWSGSISSAIGQTDTVSVSLFHIQIQWFSRPSRCIVGDLRLVHENRPRQGMSRRS